MTSEHPPPDATMLTRELGRRIRVLRTPRDEILGVKIGPIGRLMIEVPFCLSASPSSVSTNFWSSIEVMRFDWRVQ